ncbi:unnamed protein product [Pylaiella littoralis]
MNHAHHVSCAAGAGFGAGTAPPQLNNHRLNNNTNNINNAAVEPPAQPAAPAAMMESIFRLGPRFSSFKVVGKGSFGEVCSALDSHQVRAH